MKHLTDLEEIEPIAQGARLVQFNDLKKGENFQYMGEQSPFWNTVTEVSEDEISYRLGATNTPATNDKLFKSLLVWVKAVGDGEDTREEVTHAVSH